MKFSNFCKIVYVKKFITHVDLIKQVDRSFFEVYLLYFILTSIVNKQSLSYHQARWSTGKGLS